MCISDLQQGVYSLNLKRTFIEEDWDGEAEPDDEDSVDNEETE